MDIYTRVTAPTAIPRKESIVDKPKVAAVPLIPATDTRSIIFIYRLLGDGPK
jgi:hypothetical protein